MGNFSINYKGTKLAGDVLGSKPNVLVIHGAGKSDRGRYDNIRKLLFDLGISSGAFDHTGHGETAGQLEGSTLHDRSEQAIAVVKYLKMKNFSIIAGSMGGYTAVKLTEKYDIKTLALFVPGMYSANVYDIPFGGQFSEAIRQLDSWKNSDAWKIIEKFTGNLLIFRGEQDEVVPKELTQRLFDSAKNVSKKELVEINSTHAIQIYLDEHPDKMQAVINKLNKYLND